MLTGPLKSMIATYLKVKCSIFWGVTAKGLLLLLNKEADRTLWLSSLMLECTKNWPLRLWQGVILWTRVIGDNDTPHPYKAIIITSLKSHCTWTRETFYYPSPNSEHNRDSGFLHLGIHVKINHLTITCTLILW